MATPQRDLLTTAEVARLIGRSVPTVNRMAIAGRLRYAQKLPGATGAYLFDRKDVDRFLRTDVDDVRSRKAS